MNLVSKLDKARRKIHALEERVRLAEQYAEHQIYRRKLQEQETKYYKGLVLNGEPPAWQPTSPDSAKRALLQSVALRMSLQEEHKNGTLQSE